MKQIDPQLVLNTFCQEHGGTYEEILSKIDWDDIHSPELQIADELMKMVFSAIVNSGFLEGHVQVVDWEDQDKQALLLDFTYLNGIGFDLIPEDDEN